MPKISNNVELKERGNSLVAIIPSAVKQLSHWGKGFVLLDEDGSDLDPLKFFGRLQARAPDGTVHPGPYHHSFGRSDEDE
jgi:hypothetical protein